MNMLSTFKRVWRALTPLQMATDELEDAKLAKLEAESGRDYAISVVSYNTMRIKRLQEFINENTAPKDDPQS